MTTDYTIVFHAGSVMHVSPQQRDAVVRDMEKERKHMKIGNTLITLSSIARIHPSEEWIDAESQRIMGSGDYVCAFGRRHGEPCDCMYQGILPLTEGGVEKVQKAWHRVTTLKPEILAEIRSSGGNPLLRLLDSGYFQRVAEKFPQLPSPESVKLLPGPTTAHTSDP